jgi:hypothetical protein
MDIPESEAVIIRTAPIKMILTRGSFARKECRSRRGAKKPIDVHQTLRYNCGFPAAHLKPFVPYFSMAYG